MVYMTISAFRPNCATCKKRGNGMFCLIYENGIPEAILLRPPEMNKNAGLPCDGLSLYEYDPSKDVRRPVNGGGQVPRQTA